MNVRETKEMHSKTELVEFQNMVILDPNGMAFDAVGVFGLVFQLLFKSGSSYCGCLIQKTVSPVIFSYFSSSVRILLVEQTTSEFFKNCKRNSDLRIDFIEKYSGKNYRRRYDMVPIEVFQELLSFHC